jgi:hypothetical protein
MTNDMIPLIWNARVLKSTDAESKRRGFLELGIMVLEENEDIANECHFSLG